MVWSAFIEATEMRLVWKRRASKLDERLARLEGGDKSVVEGGWTGK
jgi:hypothetical protein